MLDPSLGSPGLTGTDNSCLYPKPHKTRMEKDKRTETSVKCNKEYTMKRDQSRPQWDLTAGCWWSMFWCCATVKVTSDSRHQTRPRLKWETQSGGGGKVQEHLNFDLGLPGVCVVTLALWEGLVTCLGSTWPLAGFLGRVACCHPYISKL